MARIADMAEFKIAKREATPAEFRVAAKLSTFARAIRGAFATLFEGLRLVAKAISSAVKALQDLTDSSSAGKQSYPGVVVGFPMRGRLSS